MRVPRLRRVGKGDDAVTGYLFACQATQLNLFYEAGELDPSVPSEWVVQDGQILDRSSDEPGFDDWLAFNTDFRDWMSVTHPNVYSAMSFLSLTTDFPAAESMPTALEYVDAFVADSPDWPKSPGS